MKKRKRLFLIILILVLLVPSFGIAYKGYKTVTLKVDGKEVKSDVPPIVLDGRTLVPARYLSEELGAKVEWDGKNNIVNVKSMSQQFEVEKVKEANMYYERASFMFDLHHAYSLNEELHTTFSTITADIINIPYSIMYDKEFYESIKKILDLGFKNREYLEESINDRIQDIKDSEDIIRGYYDNQDEFKKDFKYVTELEKSLKIRSKELDLLERVYKEYQKKNFNTGDKLYKEFQDLFLKNRDITLEVIGKYKFINFEAFEYQDTGRNLMDEIIY